jgi:hypothetical protein
VSLFEPIIDAMNRADVRYVVVGGVAVVLHGYARLTADLDLAVDLAPVEAAKAIDVLVDLGLVPTVPVDPSGFADPLVRAAWVSEKNTGCSRCEIRVTPFARSICSSKTSSISVACGSDLSFSSSSRRPFGLPRFPV